MKLALSPNFKLENKYILVTALVVLVANLFLPFTAGLLLLKTNPLENSAYLGDAVSGITSIFGTHFLIRNFQIQRDFYQEDKIEKQFQIRCRALDKGLENLSNRDGDIIGSIALIKTAKLRKAESITFRASLHILNITSIHILAACAD